MHLSNKKLYSLPSYVIRYYNTLVKSVWASYLPSRHVIVFQPSTSKTGIQLNQTSGLLALGLGWLSATVWSNSALTSRLYSLNLNHIDSICNSNAPWWVSMHILTNHQHCRAVTCTRNLCQNTWWCTLVDCVSGYCPASSIQNRNGEKLDHSYWPQELSQSALLTPNIICMLYLC